MRSSILIIGLILSCCLLFAVHAEDPTNNNWFQNLIARPTFSSQSEMCDNLAKALNGESDITELIDQEHFELSFPTNIFPAGNFFGVDGVRLFAQRINALMEINNKTVSVLGSDDVKQACHIDIMVDFTVRATGLKSPEGARITLVAQAWKDKFVSARLNIPSNQIYNHVSGLFLLPEQHHLKALAQGIYHVGYDSPCLAKTFLTEDTTIIIDSLAGKLQFSGYTAIARIVDWLQYHLYGMTPGNNGKRSIDSFFRGLLEESSNDNTNDKVDDDSSIIDRRRDDALLKAIADSNEDECREYLSNNRGTDEMIASDMLALATTADRVRESIGLSDNNDENSCAASTFVSNFKSHHHGHRRHFHRTLPMLLPFVHMCDHVWTEAGQTTYDCFVPPLSEPLRHFIPHRALHWMYVHGLGVRVTTHWTDDGKLNLLEYVPMQQVSFVHGDWHSHAHPDPTPDPHPDPHRRSSRPSLLNSN